MAHFARIQKQPNPFTNELEWTVHECIVVSNDVPTAAGPLGDNDMHVDGETYVKGLYKHMYSEQENTWKQYSYNANFRTHGAGRGDVYLEAADKFIGAQPFASWHLTNDTFEWAAPTTYPTVETYDNPLAGQDIKDAEGTVIGTEPAQAPYYIHWDEVQQKWLSTASHLRANEYTHEWDPSALQWNAV